MFVPEPVMSMSLTFDIKHRKDFTKAIEKFTKEDPTFTCEINEESNDIIIKGMGELHIQV